MLYIFDIYKRKIILRNIKKIVFVYIFRGRTQNSVRDYAYVLNCENSLIFLL